MKLGTKLISEYEKLLLKKGEDYFYKYVVGRGYLDRTKNENSEIIVLDMSEAFFSLFRQTGNDNYFTIGRILRKAAHRLYRDRVNSINTNEVNARFLYLV